MCLAGGFKIEESVKKVEAVSNEIVYRAGGKNIDPDSSDNSDAEFIH